MAFGSLARHVAFESDSTWVSKGLDKGELACNMKVMVRLFSIVPT